MNRFRLAGLAILALATVSRAAEEPLGAIVGDVTLPSKIAVHYEYHFAQNSLADFRIVGDHIVALTASGVLVQYDTKTRKPTRSRIDEDRIRCLGDDGDTSLLAGFESGRVCRVDPASLDCKEVAKLNGRPRWLEMRPGGLLAVVERTVNVEYKGQIFRQLQSFVEDAASGKTIPVNYQASAFLRDRQGRFWLGDDRGEWGGSVSRVDIKTGIIDRVAAPKQQNRRNWDGIYGFVELQNGQIWAYGGTMHMGFAHSSFTRVDPGQVKELANFTNTAYVKAQREGRKLPPPKHPVYPITHLVEETDGRILVFSYDAIYRADAKLMIWERVVDLTLKYRGGRPDAVGAYPAIKTIHRLPGQANDLLCATTLNGFLRVTDGKLFDESLHGRLEAPRLDRIQTSADGLLFWNVDVRDDEGESSEASPWRYKSGLWEQLSYIPPFVLHPAEIQQRADDKKARKEEEQKERELKGGQPEEKILDEVIDDEEPTDWSTTTVLIGIDGKITTVSAGSNTLTTVRWKGTKPEVLGSEVSALDPNECFLTPDGSLWNINTVEMRKFVDGQWELVTKSPGMDGDDNDDPDDTKPRRVWDFGSRLRAVNRQGPPWVLFDAAQKRLITFNFTKDTKTPIFRSLSLRITAVLPLSGNELLLATEEGLKRYDLATHSVKPCAVAEPPTVPKALCRDGLGRIWTIAGGLWMNAPGDPSVHSFKTLPMIGRTSVTAIAADPEHPDGIAASLEDGGVVFLRVPK